MRKYDHKTIEPKWQKYWLQNKTFKCDVDPSKPKYYVLDMFPYPSGAGLHVGHVEGYTATDILARHKRQRGHNVLHPMGWDSFGLAAEQYAVRTGAHPAQTTKANIDNFRRQLQSLGFSYDWDREIATSSPDYYKWTQWIFTKLYEKGLAYEAEVSVNYCPALGTVLANEEVNNGRAIEGGHLVEKRPLRQWMFKITAYAERLLEDLDLIDWPDSLKRLQINWIGKSLGATIEFSEAKSGALIPIFTTCPDTLFGVTFLVLSPEHPLVDKITTPDCEKVVKLYQATTAAESEMERTDATKAKTGVFTGAYAINPVNKSKIPIWIADYVLMGYGTGAVMAVPGHDERDFEFAMQFGLPILAVKDPELKQHPERAPAGADLQEIQTNVMAGKHCWPGEGKTINSNHGSFSIDGLSVAESKEEMIRWLETTGNGKRTVTYKLRDWLFSRQRYWGEPFPILHYDDGTKRLLELDELPLCPPEIADYKPSGDGQSPLAKVADWINIVDPKTGKKVRRESNTMPQWAGSCWYYLRFCDPKNSEQAWNSDVEKYWMPVDMYVGGVEHAVLHLLYARFWHKVLYDCGLVSTSEPFQTLRNQGLIVARSFQRNSGAYVYPEHVQEKNGKYYLKEGGEELRSQVEKMSKSKLNGVTPDEIIHEFGADSLRLYEMFMGPLEKEKIWNTDAVNGCRRFLGRFFDLAVSEKVSDEDDIEGLKLGHRLVAGIRRDIDLLQFNTCVSKMMEFVNGFSVLPSYSRNVLKMATQCLSPFAPHIAEEIWEILGCKESLSYHPFPEPLLQYLEEESVTYVVQVNGKLRGRFDLPKGEGEVRILELARANPSIEKYLDGQEIAKVVFVPNKLLNIVTK